MAWAGTPTAMNSFGISPKINKPVAKPIATDVQIPKPDLASYKQLIFI